MTAPFPADEHMQRAYAELQKPGWPPLEAMQEAFLHFVAVKGLAASYGQRPALFSKPVHRATPAPPVPMATLAAALKHPPAYDGRSAGAGEYVHSDD